MTELELRALIGRSRDEGFRQLFQQYSGYVYAMGSMRSASAEQQNPPRRLEKASAKTSLKRG